MTLDLRRLGISLAHLGAEVRYGEAILLVDALKDEPGTHCHAAVNRWNWPATFGDIALIMLTESTLNWRRDVKTQPEPTRLPRPWPDKAEIPAELRAQLTEQLRKRSVFRDR